MSECLCLSCKSFLPSCAKKQRVSDYDLITLEVCADIAQLKAENAQLKAWVEAAEEMVEARSSFYTSSIDAKYWHTKDDDSIQNLTKCMEKLTAARKTWENLKGFKK